MTDPVNAADVLAEALDTLNGPLNPEVTAEHVAPAIEALLALGGGDPVALMPDDKTLRRAQPDDGWETFTASDGEPSLRVRDDLYRFTDPVQP